MAIIEGIADPLTTKTDQPPAEASLPQSVERPGESALYEWVLALKDESARARSELARSDEWDDWLTGFWGDQWPSDLPSFKPPIVINELKKTIFEEISDLTDNRIRVYALKDRTKGDRDDLAERAIQAYWQRAFVDTQIMYAAVNAAIFPCGFLTTLYDPYLIDGQGEIVTRSRDPRTVYPDPDAEDDEHWRYVILEDVLDVLDIRRLYPVHGHRVRPEAAYSIADKTSQKPPGGGGERYRGPLYEAGSFGRVPGYKKARASVYSCFVYDEELEEQVEAVDGQPLRVSVRKKYPNGRLLVVSNGVVLYDDKNPYLGRFPVVRVLLQPSPNAFWPQTSLVSELLDAQRAANKFESQVYENAIRLNQGIVVADANSGIDPMKFASLPGQVLLKQPGSTVKIEYPSAMPPDMIQAGPRMRQYIREMLGFTPARTGLGTRGNVSPELTETEISQAMGLSRLHGRLLFQSIQKTVEMIFLRMAQFYTVPRHIPYINDDRWEPVPWQPIADARAYAIHVDPSSFQVKSKTMMQRLYLLLAKMNKIPDEDLLLNLDVPNAREIAEKNKQQLMLMAQAHALKKGKK